jgi:hypothetical protein
MNIAVFERRAIMKKFLTGLLVLWEVSGFYAGLYAGLYAQESVGSQVVIREINGKVEIKAPGATDWIPARQGQSIARTAVVSTGFKSTAVIALGNSLLSVQPLTRLTVEEIQETAGNERVNINLQTGRIRADVKPPVGGRTEFTVKSPSATASVRGTSFEFDGLNLRVEEGRVHVTGEDRSGTYVGVGHSVSADIETGRTISAIETAKEELTPSLPAGVNTAPVVLPAQPATGDIDATFYW